MAFYVHGPFLSNFSMVNIPFCERGFEFSDQPKIFRVKFGKHKKLMKMDVTILSHKIRFRAMYIVAAFCVKMGKK